MVFSGEADNPGWWWWNILLFYRQDTSWLQYFLGKAGLTVVVEDRGELISEFFSDSCAHDAFGIDGADPHLGFGIKDIANSHDSEMTPAGKTERTPLPGTKGLVPPGGTILRVQNSWTGDPSGLSGRAAVAVLGIVRVNSPSVGEVTLKGLGTSVDLRRKAAWLSGSLALCLAANRRVAPVRL